MKYFKSLAVTVIGLSIGLATLQSVQAQDAKIVVASSASLYPQYYPLAMAETHGFFKEAGLSVKRIHRDLAADPGSFRASLSRGHRVLGPVVIHGDSAPLF